MSSEELARAVRLDVLEMIHRSRASHIASAFSVADILSVLYHDVMKYDPADPNFADRDKLILSKGHAGSALYAVLAESGFFPKDWLLHYDENGSPLSGHVSHKGVPGVEFSTGSLGHGVCVACGMALANRIDGRKGRVYAIVGDGECDEGSVWEAALFANQMRLSNLTLIVDHNCLQGLGPCEEMMDLIDLGEKFRSFGWNVAETDGHLHEALRSAFFKRFEGSENPVCVIAHTVKGKGVSFMENSVLWHYRDPQGQDYERALSELKEEIQ